MVEEKPLSSGPKAITSRGRKVELTDLSTHEAEPQRASSGIDELDRVLGGGLVAASAVLLGETLGLENQLYCCKSLQLLPIKD